MGRAIKMITAQMAAPGNESLWPNAKRLTANWQTGLEAGNQVQRKLHLAFTNVAAHDPATKKRTLSLLEPMK